MKNNFIAGIPVSRIKKLWNTNKTVKNNCIRIGISTSHGYNLAKRHKLKFMYDPKRRPAGIPSNIHKTNAMKLMRLNNWTFEDIGKCFGISRQCVEQSLKRDK